MAEVNIQMRPKGTGTYADVVHPETNAGQVKTSDGSTAQVKLNTFATNFNTIAADYVRNPGYGTTGGSANTYTLTLNPALASYKAGVCVAIRIHASNTGSSTININGLGAKTIKDSKGNNLTADKLLKDIIYTLRYDGVNFILQGEGGGMEVTDYLTENYTVASGRTISAGDKVSIIDDKYVTPCIRSYLRKLTSGKTVLSLSGYSTPRKACYLDNNRILVIAGYSTTNIYGWVITVNSDGSFTAGSRQTLVTGSISAYKEQICALTATKGVLLYRNGNDFYTYAVPLTISGNTVTPGTAELLSTTKNYDSWAIRLDNNRFICGGDGASAQAIVVSCDDDMAITKGSSVQYTSGGSTDACYLDTDKIVTVNAYAQGTNDYRLYARVLTISNLTINAGTAFSVRYNAGHLIYLCGIAKLTNNSVCIRYQDYEKVPAIRTNRYAHLSVSGATIGVISDDIMINWEQDEKFTLSYTKATMVNVRDNVSILSQYDTTNYYPHIWCLAGDNVFLVIDSFITTISSASATHPVIIVPLPNGKACILNFSGDATLYGAIFVVGHTPSAIAKTGGTGGQSIEVYRL